MTQPGHDGEGRRQAYLAALGIPLWSARQALPGALPGAPLAFVPFLVEVDAAPAATVVAPAVAVRQEGMPAQEAVAAPRVTAAAPAAPAAPEARRERPLAPPAIASATPGARPAPAPTGDSRFPRLSCCVRSLGPDWTAVIALDDAPDLAALEYRLLDNIALALGADAPPAASGETLRWPLNRNPALDHGRDAMLVWLRHALRLPAGGCVVFGEALAGQVQAALPDRGVIAAPALGELLANPAAKRQLAQGFLHAPQLARDD